MSRVRTGIGNIPTLRVAGAKAALQCGRKTPHERIAHRGRAQGAPDDIPDRALLRRQMADVFRIKVDLHPRMGAVGEIVALGCGRASADSPASPACWPSMAA